MRWDHHRNETCLSIRGGVRHLCPKNISSAPEKTAYLLVPRHCLSMHTWP